MTVAKLAKALIEQHDFVWDVAYCQAYFYLHGKMTTTPWTVALSHIERVKNVPTVTEAEAERIQRIYIERNNK